MKEASFLSRYTALSITISVLAVWAKYTFVPEETSTPMLHEPMHSYKVPLFLTMGYLISLPVLKTMIKVSGVDLRPMLKESMIVYNVAQVILNVWMVYRFIAAVGWGGHPFIGNILTMNKGITHTI